MRYTKRDIEKRRTCEEYVPKCGRKDVLYKINYANHTIKKVVCINIILHARLGHFTYSLSDKTSCFSRAFGKYVFKTEKEALEQIDKLNKKAKKRELLKKYEEKLNKKFNLTDHNYF